jgi:hypothetical protein
MLSRVDGSFEAIRFSTFGGAWMRLVLSSRRASPPFLPGFSSGRPGLEETNVRPLPSTRETVVDTTQIVASRRRVAWTARDRPRLLPPLSPQ